MSSYIYEGEEYGELMPMHPMLSKSRNYEEQILDHALKRELELDVIQYDFDGNEECRRASRYDLYDRIMETYRLGIQARNGNSHLDGSDTQSGTSKVLALLKRSDAPELLKNKEVQDRIKELMNDDKELREELNKLKSKLKDKLKDKLNSEVHLKEIATKEIEKDMAENNETLNKFKKLIKNPESERNETEELRNYVIESFPKGDDDFDYLKLDSVEVDKILYRLREFGVIENLEFSIESKNKKISATIDTDEDFNEYKEVLDSIFINNNTNISWVNIKLGSITEDFQNGDDAETTELEDEYILVYSHKLNKFRLYDPKEFEFAWGTSYDKLYEDDDEGNEPEAVVETPKKTSNSNCISWT